MIEHFPQSLESDPCLLDKGEIGNVSSPWQSTRSDALGVDEVVNRMGLMHVNDQGEAVKISNYICEEKTTKKGDKDQEVVVNNFEQFYEEAGTKKGEKVLRELKELVVGNEGWK